MDAKTTTRRRGYESKEAKRLPTEEAARLGREMYEQDIRHLVEADHAGEIVALDVDSGIWGIGEDTMDARERLRAKRPEAVNVMFERVGYLAVHSFGGGNPRSRTASHS